MLDIQQEQVLIKMIPEGTIGEDLRAAYSIITGIRDDKTLPQIIIYYSLSSDIALKWYEFFSFENNNLNIKKKKGRKGKDLISYVKSNIGKVITPKSVVEELDISLPTFYNFYNANRGFFKKIKRGEFEIVDPNLERSISK